MNNRKSIGKALVDAWKAEVMVDSKMCPLMYYLEYNYRERYVSLCKRVGVVS